MPWNSHFKKMFMSVHTWCSHLKRQDSTPVMLLIRFKLFLRGMMMLLGAFVISTLSWSFSTKPLCQSLSSPNSMLKAIFPHLSHISSSEMSYFWFIE